ncbi:hypothetical protein JCM10914A_03080 [Paenibacillus sp. JCM 10914]
MERRGGAAANHAVFGGRPQARLRLRYPTVDALCVVANRGGGLPIRMESSPPIVGRLEFAAGTQGRVRGV